MSAKRAARQRETIDWSWAQQRLSALFLRLLVGVAEMVVLLAFGAAHYGLTLGLGWVLPDFVQLKALLETATLTAFTVVYLRQLYEVVRVFLA